MSNVIKDEVVTQIYKTMDYSKFKFISSNRKINKSNYAKLYASMKKKQLMIPIQVNGKMEIIDGQHRYCVARDLGLPVFYYIEENADINDMKIANQASCNWTKNDFLNSYADDGDDRYCKVLRICDEYNISAGPFLRLLSKMQGRSSVNVSLEFEDGTIDIEGIDEVEKFLECLEDFKEFKYYKTMQFMLAYFNVYSRESYDHENMIKRLESRGTKVQKRSSTDDYIVLLTRDIYNFGRVKKSINYDPINKKFYA